MRLQPLAGEPLRFRDLIGRHLARYLDAVSQGFSIAPRGSEVEPLVCHDKIGRSVAPSRIKHTEFEECVSRPRLCTDSGLVRRYLDPRHGKCPLF